MKKIKNLFLAAVVAATSIATLASCSSTDEVVMSIDPTIQSNGITTDLGGGIFTDIVSSSSALTVEIPESGGWVSYDEQKAKQGYVTLIVEENFTGIDRSTTVRISGGGTSYDISVKQASTEDGEEATNDELEFANIAANKGLGRGYNFYSSTKSKAMEGIFNMNKIFSLQKNDSTGDIENLIREDVESELNAVSAHVDSIEDKKDSVGVALSCDISYGLFKFNVKGEFHSDENRYSKVKKYKVGAKVPALTSTLAYSSVLELAEESTEMSKLLCTGFKKLRNKIETLAGEGKTASDDTLDELCETYGAMFVSGATLGGLLNLYVEIDSTYCVESMAVDSAKVTLAINSGLLKIDAGIEVTYAKEAVDILKHSNVSLDIRGGKVKEYGSLIRASLGQDEQVDKVNEWIKTITLSDDKNTNNTDVVSLELRPIWMLFSSSDDDKPSARSIVKNYVLNKYADVPELDVYR